MVNYNKVLKSNPVLRTERLILRPFTIDDVEDVFSYASDAIVTKYLRWFPHKTIDETKKILKNSFIDKAGTFAIELKKENKVLGCIELRLCKKHDKASFGYVLNKEYWNKGYMTEALEVVLKFSFKKLKLNRIESTHYVGNEGSGRVMKKCGMMYEGKGIQEVKVKGKYYDVIHYAILKEDWFSNK